MIMFSKIKEFIDSVADDWEVPEVVVGD